MQELIGVKFLPNISQSKPWRAQINRAGRAFYLGLYKRSDEACRAYDNAVYYLKPWASSRTMMLLNFPLEWNGGEIAAPLPSTIKIRAKLREMLPGAEAAVMEKGNLKDSEVFELSSLQLIENIQHSSATLQKRFTDAISRLKLLEARLAQSDMDIKQRDRIITGLRSQGGQQFFKKVNQETVQTTAVESHLL